MNSMRIQIFMKTGEKFMTREEHFEDIKVVKENHLCEMTIMEENLMLCIDSMLKENKEV